jgi:ABC-2 type transport system permease protein
MSGFTRLAVQELRLFLREPMAVLVVVALPLALVSVFGAIFDPETNHDPIGTYFPAMALGLALAQLALNLMPTTMVTYRERGILRRMSATPIHPRTLLAAQLAVALLAAVLAALIVVLVGALVIGFGRPGNLPGFLAGFLLGSLSLFSVGLVVAAVAPSARAATGIGLVLFFASMFFGGVFMPVETMPPDLARIGEYTPLGAAMDTFRSSWAGNPPEVAPLVVMAVITVVLSAVAARAFRWE